MAKAKRRARVRAATEIVEAQSLVSRQSLRTALVGETFGGKRDVFEALGYQKRLRVADYRLRYYRNAVAARVVEAFPKASWRGGAELVENTDPTKETKFEAAWESLRLRLNPWGAMLRTDILAGLGTYAGLIIGARGNFESALPKAIKPEDLKYFASYAEDELKIESYDERSSSERYGLPEFYLLTRGPKVRDLQQTRPSYPSQGQKIHWTRVIHVADGLLDDRCFGTPRMERVWNLTDDLEKVTGAGSEAFWQRANGGTHMNVDPTVIIDEEERREMEAQADEYIHGQRKLFQTRGVDVNRLGSDTANFESNVKAIMMQIAAGANLPMRILTGTESGELASSQDRTNWAERVADRRKEVCEVHIRALVDRLIEYGYLPQPKSYMVDWPREEDLTEEQRTTIAARMCVANQAQVVATGYVLMTSDEVRDRYLSLPPLEDVLDAEELTDGGVLRLPEGNLATQPPQVESTDSTLSKEKGVDRKDTGNKARNRQSQEAAVDATVEALRRRREMALVPPAGRVPVKKALRHRTRQQYAKAAS